jgi:hypothetical protein
MKHLIRRVVRHLQRTGRRAGGSGSDEVIPSGGSGSSGSAGNADPGGGGGYDPGGRGAGSDW